MVIGEDHKDAAGKLQNSLKKIAIGELRQMELNLNM